MLSRLNNKEIQEHKLEGYLYKFHPNLLSPEQTKEYKRTWSTQWLQGHHKIYFLKQLNQWNKDKNYGITLLKGAALIAQFYPDIGSRFMSDVDLLIEKKDTDEITAFLESLGFELVHSSTWIGNDFKSVYKKKDINIELHSRIFFHSNTQLETTKHPTLTSLQIFSSEEQFVHLAGHFAFQHNCLKLYWLIDLVHLTTSAIDWNKVSTLANILKMKRAVNCCQYILKSEFNLKLPYKKNLVHLLINRNFLKQYNQKGWRYFLIKHLLKDSILTALNYDFFWIIAKIKRLNIKSKTEKNSAET